MLHLSSLSVSCLSSPFLHSHLRVECGRVKSQLSLFKGKLKMLLLTTFFFFSFFLPSTRMLSSGRLLNYWQTMERELLLPLSLSTDQVASARARLVSPSSSNSRARVTSSPCHRASISRWLGTLHIFRNLRGATVPAAAENHLREKKNGGQNIFLYFI